ncbi:ovostatin-like isoform X1 [Ranitomeya imitator]|uniref:ovostatin-like isoform X1 n=1 Tax=Ranitomeya imitator TaxID=111125 RepID=UPI0037E7DCEC
MWTKRLLLSISLLGLISRAKFQLTEEPFPDPVTVTPYPIGYDDSVPKKDTIINYAMIVSVTQQSGKTGQVCIFIDCEESVQLSVTLEYQDIRISIFNQLVTSTFFECGFFQVPLVESAQMAYVSFSAVGATVDKRERKGVVFEAMRGGCFAQLEKTLYAQGEIVRCRVFCLDFDLKPTKQRFTRVFLVEPNGARLAQILDPSSDHDVTSVEIPLNEDAGTGSYYLVFEKESGESVYSYFTVERYQLPRFRTAIVCPNQISVLEKSAPIEVSAEYVYGKPLQGSVIGKCCRNVGYTYGRAKNCMRGLENICVDFTGELDSGGYIKSLDLDIFLLQFSEYDNSINCEVTVKEDGTDVLDTQSCYIYITNQPVNLQLDYSYYNQYYKHGLDYLFAATLTDEKGTPMPQETIIIEVDGQIVRILTTDDKGRVECAINTALYYTPNITIRASYQNEDQCYVTNQDSSWMYYPEYPYRPNPEYPSAEITAYRFFSESNSFIQMKRVQGPLSCNKNHSIEVEYKVTAAGVGKHATSVTFYHLIKARGQMTLHSTKSVDLSDDGKGSYQLDLLVNSDYGTSAQVLVLATMQTEIISDSVTLAIESCFNNQVSLDFTEAVVTPGSTVVREISAAPGSFCGLKASDVSLRLLGSYDSFSPDYIYGSVNSYQYGYYIQGFDLTEPAPPCEDPNTEVFCEGRYYRRVSSPTDGDSYQNFLSSSLIVASNLLVRKPQVCGMENAYSYYGGTMYSTASASPRFAAFDAPQGGAGFNIVRSNFASTFGWDSVLIGSDGRGTATSTIPHTITEWESSAFCISESAGVGLTNEPAKVLTFLPFFAEVTVAQYCTRGERSIIVVSASNYLGKCVKVKLEIEASDDYVATPYSDDDDEVFICDKGRASKQWVLDFTNIGDISVTASASTMQTLDTDSCHDPNGDNEGTRKDTVIKVIKVEAEGVKNEVAFSYLHHVDDSSEESSIEIQNPYNIVEGSYELYATVVGDTMQLGVENLNRLLNLPDGCCEQNLLRIISTAIFHKYLSDMGRLTPELNETVKNVLINAYARQLPCRSWDGQYSVYRNSFVPNSWVLVNSFYAFELAKDIIYVDTEMQQQTLLHLGNLQDLTTGCFHPVGSFFTTQDKKENDILFTAYVVQRLLKCYLYGIGDSLLQGGLRCLRNADLESLNTYALAYTSYAAALADVDIFNRVLNILRPKAIAEGGTIHWESENLPLRRPYYYASADVDITANIFLALLKTYTPTPENKAFLGQIAAWLTFCQNSRGGYSSSQDSMMAIEAMTQYGRLFFVEESDAVVVVQQGDIEVARINVDESNKLLVQRVKLDVVLGEYKIYTTGTGNPLVQLNSYFNTKATNEGSSLSLTVTVQDESCTNGIAHAIHFDICVGYHGSRGITNMILVDIKELTGYQTDRNSVYKLVSEEKISEHGFEDNHIYLYLQPIGADTEVCFSVTSYMENRVLAYHSGTVIARDYYYGEDVVSAPYYHPCSPLHEE